MSKRPRPGDVFRRIGVDAPGNLPDLPTSEGSGQSMPSSLSTPHAGDLEDMPQSIRLAEVADHKSVRILLGGFVRRQRNIITEVQVYGTVVSLTERAATPEQSSFVVGTVVELRQSMKYSQQVGLSGVVIGAPDDNGLVVVVLEDGTLDLFYIGEEDDSAREIEVHPLSLRRAVVSVDNRTLEVEYPIEMTLNVGDEVALYSKTMQITAVVGRRDVGEVAVVSNLIDDDSCEVEYRGGNRVVHIADDIDQVSVGARVVLDYGGQVVKAILSMGNQFAVENSTDVSWSDVVGQDEAIQLLQDLIELPAKAGDVFQTLNIGRSKGVLLCGPPGCGKTLIMRAVATSLARAHGSDKPIGFLLVNGPDIFEHLVGAAERKVRALFDWCRAFESKYGFPAVLAIDEADAIAKRRGSGISSDATDTIVNALLVEMDGFEKGGPVVMMATNRRDIFDPAITRDGRIDQTVWIKRPDQSAAEHIFRLYLAKRPLIGIAPDDAAAQAASLLFDTKYAFYNIQVMHPATEEGGQPRQEDVPFTLGHITSGAMIAGIVNKAARLAARRAVADPSAPVGVTMDDLKAAIQSKFEENAKLDHIDALKEHRNTITDPVKDIQKLHQKR